MKRTAWILLLLFISCKHHDSEKGIDSLLQIKRDTMRFANDLQKASDSLYKKPNALPDINATIPPFTNDIYKKYIPDTVLSLIDTKITGWHLPSPDSWERFWFKEYKNDSVLVNYISADYNGDTKKDYALILINEKKEFGVWILQSNSFDYEAINLLKIGKPTLQIDVGLELIPKGKLNYIDFNADMKSIYINNPAIQVSYFESSAETYYWNRGKYKSVTTGD